MHTHLRLTHALTEEKYKREVVVIPIDFSDGMEIYPNIAEQLKDLDIGVLSMSFTNVFIKSVYHNCHLFVIKLQSIVLDLDMSILNSSMNVQLM